MDRITSVPLMGYQIVDAHEFGSSHPYSSTNRKHHVAATGESCVAHPTETPNPSKRLVGNDSKPFGNHQIRVNTEAVQGVRAVPTPDGAGCGKVSPLSPLSMPRDLLRSNKDVMGHHGRLARDPLNNARWARLATKHTLQRIDLFGDVEWNSISFSCAEKIKSRPCS